jgi:hypothetical protein
MSADDAVKSEGTSDTAAGLRVLEDDLLIYQFIHSRSVREAAE